MRSGRSRTAIIHRRVHSRALRFFVQVDQLLPEVRSRAVAELVAKLQAATPGLPFADDAVEFCTALSQRLMTDPGARAFPEVMALGFFIRKSELTTLARSLETAPSLLRVAQGLVFHIPPANVDTVFAYSWLLSLLMGNLNLVRLSRRASPVVELVVDHARALLQEPRFARLADGNVMVRYPHDASITAALSAVTRLRVIWGGDAAISAVRRAPLPAYGRDLTFADRTSLAVLAAPAVAALEPPALTTLAEGLYADVFWFDQAACSSPRLVMWIGDAASIIAASDRLWPALAAVAEQKGFVPEPGHVSAKETFAFAAIADGQALQRRRFSGRLTVLTRSDVRALPSEHPGAGLLWEASTDSLEGVAAAVTARTQTLSQFGFSHAELSALCHKLAGRGVDRVVPIGKALAFGRYWDGRDLLAEFSKLVHLSEEKS
jgi:hypothetical protein